MAGGNIAQVGSALLQRADRQTAFVNFHRYAGDAVVFQYGAGAAVAGVFHRGGTARKQVGQAAQQVLHPGPDHDLIRCAVHAAVLAKVGGNLGAQVFIPLHITPLQQLRPLVHQLFLNAPPAAGREEGSIYTAS